MQRLDTYPLLNPKVRRISMKSTSELMMGIEEELEDRWMLHIRNIGMKSVRARERDTSRLEDQTWTRSN